MKERYKQFQKANRISYGLSYPTKGRIYDRRRSARAHRKARKAGMGLWEYSLKQMLGGSKKEKFVS